MHGTFAKNILIASATSQPGLADLNRRIRPYISTWGCVDEGDEAVNFGPGRLVSKALPLAYSCDGQGLADIKLRM